MNSIDFNLASAVKGFGIGMGLIVAIGAQNAYVLTRGICRNHHWAAALIGSTIDALLIVAGIMGMGVLIQKFPNLLLFTTIGGALFLFVYGAISFRKMSGTEQLQSSGKLVSLKTAVVSMLAFSLLNPHVYLDTVILLGSVAIQEHPHHRIAFGIGAVSASFVWFFSLALGGQWLQPWFQSPATWRLLDFAVGMIMWSIALTLIVRLI
jgi:L-lysine exporter family protein LysE/ArgO